MEAIKSRKEREKEFRKKEIIDSAVHLFALKGFDNTTLDDIAVASEFGKATIYNYFSSKEDIFLAIIEEIVSEYSEMIKLADSESSGINEFFLKLTTSIIDFCVKNQHKFLILLHMRSNSHFSNPETVNNRIMEMTKFSDSVYENWLKKGVRKKEIKNIDPKRIMSFYRGILFNHIYFILNCGVEGNIDPQKEGIEILDLLFNGIKIK